jgi:hypothetical protein
LLAYFGFEVVGFAVVLFRAVVGFFAGVAAFGRPVISMLLIFTGS